MSARQAHYPNLDAIAAQIAVDAHEESDLLQHTELYSAWDSILFSTGIHQYEDISGSFQSS